MSPTCVCRGRGLNGPLAAAVRDQLVADLEREGASLLASRAGVGAPVIRRAARGLSIARHSREAIASLYQGGQR